MVGMTLFIVYGTIWAYVTILFILSLVLKRNDIADVAWGPGIALAGITAVAVSDDITERMLLIATLVVIWALRLAVHIFLRNKHKKEDPRYAAWRESWGKWFLLRSYFQVYILQGLLMVVVAYSLLHVSLFDEGGLGWLDLAGVLIWIVGFVFESIGDYQLSLFVSNPEHKGKVMRYGLWKYTRHPNYFGEVTQWWGIFLIALGSAYGFAAIISPIMITFLILGVSGIPMLEQMFDGNEEYQEYKKRTSAFFPWFPKAE